MPPISPSHSTPRPSPQRRSSPQKSFRSTDNHSTPQKKTVLLFKYLFLALLLILVYSLLRINLQLIQRLDDSNRRDEQGHNDAIAPQSAMDSNSNGQDPALQERLVALRTEVTTMQKKVDDLKERMRHTNGIRRSSSANVILGTGDTGGGDSKQLKRKSCTATQTTQQSLRLQKRFSEWWSHSACPDQLWMDNIHTLFNDATSTAIQTYNHTPQPYVVLDIGCNKGYTSADFFDALSPGSNVNPHTLVGAIRAIAAEDKTKYDRDGGVCNDSNKALNVDRRTVREVEVHCFEPSPATFDMLLRAHAKLLPANDSGGSNGGGGGGAKWFIHNKGLHNVNGKMSWHKACAHAVGDELCTIVDERTPDAITVPVITVDKFMEETYPNNDDTNTPPPLVHMLKIDAEGLDPAVLTGAMKLLTENRAIMVMFEFNPRLSEKGDHPHGMWGKGGKPQVSLIEVTNWLDDIGYDCYLDTRLVDDNEKKKGVPEAPGLYRITGECMAKEPNVRGWANVVCASRRYGNVAWRLLELASIVNE